MNCRCFIAFARQKLASLLLHVVTLHRCGKKNCWIVDFFWTLSFWALFFPIPEFLTGFCSRVIQVAAEGRVESIIFRYCSLARFRRAFRSLMGIEVEPVASSFCPEHTSRGWFSFCRRFRISFCLTGKRTAGRGFWHQC